MADSGPYRPPRYCGECGNPFSWTATALRTAREYTDGLDQLSAEEKAELKGTFDDLVADTPRTAISVSRFKKLMTKIGPQAGGILQKVVETVLTEAAKKGLGL